MGAPVIVRKDAPSSNTQITARYILLGVPMLVAWWFIYKSLEPFAGWLARYFVRLLSSHDLAIGNIDHLRSSIEFFSMIRPRSSCS